MTLPGAKRKSCTLCQYIPPAADAPPAPFQGYNLDRSKHKRKIKINLSSHLLSIVILLGAYFAYQYVNQEPEELEGMRAMEQSYNKVTRLITAEALSSPPNRANLRKLIKREKAVISHLRVSPCLLSPRTYLTNLYTVFDKSLGKSSYDFKNSRRVISISSKFVNGASECKDAYDPNQYSALKLYSNYPDVSAAK